MVMSSIEIKVPEKAKQYVVKGTTEKMRNALLLYPCIANGTISHGKAAEVLGIHKTELLQLYGSVGIPYLDMTDDEFEEEVQMARGLVRDRR